MVKPKNAMQQIKNIISLFITLSILYSFYLLYKFNSKIHEGNKNLNIKCIKNKKYDKLTGFDNAVDEVKCNSLETMHQCYSSGHYHIYDKHIPQCLWLPQNSNTININNVTAFQQIIK